MKTKVFMKLLLFFVFLCLSLSVYAQEQQIVTGPSGVVVAPSSTVSVPLNYTTSNGMLNQTGIGFRVHFDSRELTLNNVSGIYGLHAIGNQIFPETANDSDNDSNTDMVLVISWAVTNGDADILAAGWPSNCEVSVATIAILNGQCPENAVTTQPVELVQMNFSSSSNFSGTSLNIIPTSSDAAFSFASSTFTIGLLSSDATLSSLSLTGVMISPAFTSTVTSYTASVPFAVDSVTVAFTTNESNANAVVSGSTLLVGNNNVVVTVTAEDGSTQNYTIVVTRAAAPTVTIIGAAITSANHTAYSISGTCSFNGQVVTATVGGIAAGSVNCSNLTWSITGIDVSGLSDGIIELTADHTDGQGSATQAAVTVIKDTVTAITAPANITVEATAELTPVDIGQATALDANQVAIPASNIVPSTTGPFPIGVTEIVWTATNSNGISVSSIQTITVTNSLASVISLANNPVTVRAEGVFTNRTFEELGISIADSTTFTVGYLLNNEVITSDSVIVTSGVSTLTITATGIGNLTSEVSLVINVNPTVTFGADKVVGGGNTFNISAILSGEPITFPVVVPFSIEGSENLVNAASTGAITIESGREASIQFTAVSNPELASVDVMFAIDSDELSNNVVVNGVESQVVRIVNQNVAPILSIDLLQSGSQTSVVALGAGSLTILAEANDANNDSLTFSFDLTQDTVNIATQGSSASNTFTVDITGLTEGSVLLTVTVSDGALSTTIARNLAVINATMVRVDSDGDGIGDEFDTLSEENLLSVDVGSGREQVIISSEQGLTLRLGSAAIVDGNGAQVTVEDLQNTADENINVLENFGPDFSSQNIELIDYEISNLAEMGASVAIVFPLGQATTAFSRLRKYNANNNQWSLFVENENNIISTAVTEDPLGVCPESNSTEYQNVTASNDLPVGIYCIRLLIEDGGTNDADGIANGEIIDPIGVQQITGTGDSTLASLDLGQILAPAFAPAVTEYTVNVPNSVTNITVNAIANNGFATVSGTGMSTLRVGSNTINVTVTAVDGSSTVNTITVLRESSGNIPTIIPTTTTSTTVSTTTTSTTVSTTTSSSSGGSLNWLSLLALLALVLRRRVLK